MEDQTNYRSDGEEPKQNFAQKMIRKLIVYAASLLIVAGVLGVVLFIQDKKQKEETARIVQRANKEAELEKGKVQDDIKKEMITVAREMAGKLVEVSIDDAKQVSLIDETLKEMGDSTWQS